MHGTALYDTIGLRALEAAAARHLGNDGAELMRRAGAAAWRHLLQHWPRALRVVVVCGPGNNGGDGYVLASHAHRAGRPVTVVQWQPPRTALAQQACRDYQHAGGVVVPFEGVLPDADLLVDALFGIGLSRRFDEPTLALIDAINQHPAPVFALDVPSGVDADRGGTPSRAVVAARTLQFIAPHLGLYTGAALNHAGVLETDTLEIPPEPYEGIAPAAEWLQAPALRRWLASRRRDSHKGQYGRVLCIGGELGSGGALILAAEAALRGGAGLVEAATRAVHVPALLARRPEVMARAVESAEDLAPLLARADVIALGPGLGTGDWGAELFYAALAARKPGVLDADGLNLLAERPRPLPRSWVLTPHPGEAGRLLGISPAEVQADRPAAARALVEAHQAAVVLKGAGTIVAAPGALPRVVGAGNPGMAVGGMGDLLTGVIAALLAQGLSAFDAASCGALLHAAAGDIAAGEGGERGLLPADLLPALRRLANPRGAH
ncbi:NAD(P)H-hydrate dehydratase [Vulcaniibacterium gelatinicum]|uniref:NAD(P)H-hydrate dehydratase n=1 Tax=Vulcaniibacterium gelatinicum TaxID=2598725 RepID=UPI0011C7E588|nr:NAD(P)H-hydrate dehydratase [Vulcaniibacterium gelatinicum]